MHNNPYESPPEVPVVVTSIRPQIRSVVVWRSIFLIALFSLPFFHGAFVWSFDQKNLPDWMSLKMRDHFNSLVGSLFALSQITTAVAFMAWLAAALNEKRAKRD
jgi:hypothetical protein